MSVARRKETGLFIVFLLLLILLPACILLPIPHKEPDTPLVSGIVLDKTTGAPITEALVRLSIPGKNEQEEFVHVSTDLNGRYEAQVYRFHWWLFILLLPHDPVCSYGLRVEHTSYKTVGNGGTYLGSCWTMTLTHNIQMEKLAPQEQQQGARKGDRLLF